MAAICFPFCLYSPLKLNCILFIKDFLGWEQELEVSGVLCGFFIHCCLIWQKIGNHFGLYNVIKGYIYFSTLWPQELYLWSCSSKNVFFSPTKISQKMISFDVFPLKLNLILFLGNFCLVYLTPLNHQRLLYVKLYSYFT